jgi:hypothetical protein
MASPASRPPTDNPSMQDNSAATQHGQNAASSKRDYSFISPSSLESNPVDEREDQFRLGKRHAWYPAAKNIGLKITDIMWNDLFERLKEYKRVHGVRYIQYNAVVS